MKDVSRNAAGSSRRLHGIDVGLDRARRLAACTSLVIALATGCATAPAPPPVLDALFPDGRRTEALAALADAEALPADEDFRVRELARDAHASHHLVWIRDREVPHRHDRHDLVVVVLRGHGGMRLGAEERPVGEGSILWIPRGTPHAFRNASGDVAVAYAIYTPAFDPSDRVPEPPVD